MVLKQRMALLANDAYDGRRMLWTTKGKGGRVQKVCSIMFTLLPSRGVMKGDQLLIVYSLLHLP